MARDFDGAAGSYLGIGDVAALDLTGAVLSLFCWVNPDINSAAQYLISKATNTVGSWQYALLLETAANKVTLEVADGAGNTQLSGATTVSTGVWQAVGATKAGDGASQAKVYLNGAVDATGTIARTMVDSTVPVELGRRASADRLLDGKMAEAAIWDAALTDDEMAALAKGFSPALIRPQSLRGHFPLIGNASPEPELRNSNNATINGSVVKADHPRIILPNKGLYVP